MTDDSDTVLMENIGHNHRRPGDRRLVVRDQPDSAVLVEQMANDDGGWRDVDRIAVIRIEGSVEVLRST